MYRHSAHGLSFAALLSIATFVSPLLAAPFPARPDDELRFELYSRTTLELFWTRATNGLPPLRYEVSRDGIVLGVTSGIHFLDDTVPALDALVPDASNNYGSDVTYRVTSIDANGKRSNPRKLVADIEQAIRARNPSMPTGLRTVIFSSTVVDLRWGSSPIGTVPAGHEIWLGTDRKELSSSRSLLGKTKGHSFLLKGLMPDRTYPLFVIAYDAAGGRSEESVIWVTTPFRRCHLPR